MIYVLIFMLKVLVSNQLNFFLVFSVLPLLIITAVIDDKKRLLLTKKEQLVSLYSPKKLKTSENENLWKFKNSQPQPKNLPVLI